MEFGQRVLVPFQNPREKFWGLMLSLDPAANVRGLVLRSLDDFTPVVKSGEAASASVVFFPTHRAQRIQKDNRNGELPAPTEQFRAETGLDVRKFFQERRK